MKLKKYKTFPTIINDKKELESAIDDFGCNICKGSKRLKQDKDLVIKAIEKDATTALYLDEKQKQDPDIKRAVERKDRELEEFIDPISELAKQKDPSELSLLVQARNKILYDYLHPTTQEAEPKKSSVFTRDRKPQRTNDIELGG